MNKRFVAILLICVALFVGAFVFGKSNNSNNSNQTNVPATNHTQGNPEAKVTLLEYGDFQCPACGSYYPIVKEVKAKYGDQLKFQFRHFPIVGIHPNAMAAHRAAEAADKQGKFWEMHDVLYEQQSAWVNNTNVAAIFEAYATQLGLNIDQYKQDLTAVATKDAIDADIQAGKDADVSGTPSFFINGEPIDNNDVRDVAAFSALIDKVLNSQSAQ